LFSFFTFIYGVYSQLSFSCHRLVLAQFRAIDNPLRILITSDALRELIFENELFQGFPHLPYALVSRKESAYSSWVHGKLPIGKQENTVDQILNHKVQSVLKNDWHSFRDELFTQNF
jgi:hypothetical protein